MLVKNWKAKFASSLKEAGYKNKQIAEIVTIFEKGFAEYDPKSYQLLHGEIDILDVIYNLSHPLIS